MVMVQLALGIMAVPEPLWPRDHDLGARQPIHTTCCEATCNHMVAICNLPSWLSQEDSGEAGRKDHKLLG